jgi:hypothetical protein
MESPFSLLTVYRLYGLHFTYLESGRFGHLNLDHRLDLGSILLGRASRHLLIPGFIGATKQTAALILGTCLTLEEPVTEEDFRSGLWRLVDLFTAIGGEEDGLQRSRNASRMVACVILGVHSVDVDMWICGYGYLY